MNPVSSPMFRRVDHIGVVVADLAEARRRRLGEGNRARIEHIAVEVDDLGASLAHLAARGVQTTSPDPRRIGGTLNAWTVGETTGGVSYQLIERSGGPAAGDGRRR